MLRTGRLGRRRCAAGYLRVPVKADLARRAGAEAVGTAFLVAAVIGSGIAAQRLSPHDVGLQLLENSLILPGKRYEDWTLTDPAGQPIDVVRQVRDDIRHRVQQLVNELLPDHTSEH